MFRYGYYYDEQGNPTDYPGYFMGVVLSGGRLASLTSSNTATPSTPPSTTAGTIPNRGR